MRFITNMLYYIHIDIIRTGLFRDPGPAPRTTRRTLKFILRYLSIYLSISLSLYIYIYIYIHIFIHTYLSGRHYLWKHIFIRTSKFRPAPRTQPPAGATDNIWFGVIIIIV